ncbi:hypothetical protein ACF5W4_10185 [Bacillota bacterium Lsc_1132]
MITIDIDRLLEATAELQTEKNDFPMKKIEIDLILENTREFMTMKK